MSLTLFQNFKLLDPHVADETVEGYQLLVEDGRVKELSDKPIKASTARSINCGGRTLMPGLIDCHVHVIAVMVNIGQNAQLPDATVAYRAARVMKGMLDRGFTTVRDLGGATYPLVEAQEQGLIEAPRLIIPGKALSQTGGHGDSRSRYDARDPATWNFKLGSLGRLVDGVAEVRKACREELKQGAHFIKIMANGGVASPNDPIHFLGFSREEVTAAVEEAENAGAYVAAHLYTDAAIRRAVECGVHSLEHCNLIQADTAKFAAEKGAIACPTLVTYEYLGVEGPQLGLAPESIAKVDTVRISGMKSLEIMKQAGLTMAYGSDLLGEMHRHQSEEFVIRGRVLPAIEVIRSATVHAAKLLRQEGHLGTLRAGAHADIVLVDGDPLKDLALLIGQGKHLALIMQGGRMHKNTLN
ncbi:amidohydrolase family protein [Terrarubrum flagellatum]|uniref:metal-dependent hydrolase family protein n=1 Tax=Terrirubrum flagellatum TaxID=2895980 RepID=UPI0031453B45